MQTRLSAVWHWCSLWWSGTASADCSWRMLGLPYKSAVCPSRGEDHCFGCQLVGCGFYVCPLAQRVCFAIFTTSFHVVFQVPNFPSYAECDRSLVSLTFDSRCGMLWPCSLKPRIEWRLWEPHMKIQLGIRQGSSCHIPTAQLVAFQGWHHPGPDRHALGRGDASAMAEEQGSNGSPRLRPNVHWSLGACSSTWFPQGVLADETSGENRQMNFFHRRRGTILTSSLVCLSYQSISCLSSSLLSFISTSPFLWVDFVVYFQCHAM